MSSAPDFAESELMAAGYSAFGGDAPAPVKEMILSIKLKCLHDGSETIVKIVRNTPFSHIIQMYADSKNVSEKRCRFYIRASKTLVSPCDSPDKLGLHNGVEIEAKVDPFVKPASRALSFSSSDN